jgi:hypothetical protein
MPDAADSDAAVQSDGRNDYHRAIVSDLKCLIEHVQASMELVELAIAGEPSPGDHEVVTNVVVLDDVTPRYVKAKTTLNSCNAGLRIALHVLLDARTSEQHERDGSGSGRLRLI